MRQIQLAHLYKNGKFYGYGISVDGQLLSNQVAVTIDMEPNQPAIMHVDFKLDSKVVSNLVDIELNNNSNHN